MQLKELLRWVVSGGGAGVLAYYIIARVRWPADFPSETKRYITFAGAFLLADLCWLAMVFSGYDVLPVNALGWVEQLFLVGTTSIGLSQIIHGAVDLRASDKARGI